MRFWLYLALLLTGLSLAGCGAELSKADLGTVVFEMPKVSGTEGPYEMPQLGPPATEKGEASGSHLP
jgi:hypothetical protein